MTCGSAPAATCGAALAATFLPDGVGELSRDGHGIASRAFFSRARDKDRDKWWDLVGRVADSRGGGCQRPSLRLIQSIFLPIDPSYAADQTVLQRCSHASQAVTPVRRRRNTGNRKQNGLRNGGGDAILSQSHRVTVHLNRIGFSAGGSSVPPPSLYTAIPSLPSPSSRNAPSTRLTLERVLGERFLLLPCPIYISVDGLHRGSSGEGDWRVGFRLGP
jgi:hypothetical protein